MLRTEFEFTLPCGLVDDEGDLHREGVMRRSRAADEILPQRDPRVVKNPAYLIVIILSRVITRLGTVEAINPKTIENLFTTDLAYLQTLYNCINSPDPEQAPSIVCPHCKESFVSEPSDPGGSSATPSTSSWGR